MQSVAALGLLVRTQDAVVAGSGRLPLLNNLVGANRYFSEFSGDGAFWRRE